METIPRIPPNDNEAEQALLSAMLFDREAVATAYEILSPGDFYNPANSAIYDAMTALFIVNTPVDAVTLKNKLFELGVLEQVGGMAYLAELSTGYYALANVRHYAGIIAEKSLLRKLIKAGDAITSDGFQGQDPVETILERAEKSIFDIAQNRNTTEFSHIRDVLAETIQKTEQAYLNKTKITGLETGFADLDYKMAGLQPAELILIAARPSMGKTAFALNIAQHIAVRLQKPTAIFSLEMSKEQLVNRLLCSEAMLDAQKLRTGDLKDEDWDLIIDAMGPLSRAPLYLDDTPGINATEIRAKCRRLKLEKGLDLILIDYLQLMSGSGSRSDSRQQEISDISRSLKALAREMNAPVIALSQLSRACEQRADHRPILSDLRESGAIEQDADVVAFIYRDEYYHPETEQKNIAEIIIAKQRNGPTGSVPLTWLGQYTKFVNAART